MKKVFVILTLGVFLGIMFWVLSMPKVTFVNVPRQMNDQLQVKQAELLDKLQKRHWLLTRSKDFEAFLNAQPHVKTASVQKKGFGELIVAIDYRVALAAVKSGSIYIMIDDQGVVLSIGDAVEAPYIIEGFEVEVAEIGKGIVTANSELIVKAVQLVDLFERFTDVQPNVHLIDGNLVQILAPKFQMNFGKGYDIVRQFNEAMSIYEDLIKKQSNTGIINLAIPGQTVIQTWKN